MPCSQRVSQSRTSLLAPLITRFGPGLPIFPFTLSRSAWEPALRPAKFLDPAFVGLVFSAAVHVVFRGFLSFNLRSPCLRSPLRLCVGLQRHLEAFQHPNFVPRSPSTCHLPAPWYDARSSHRRAFPPRRSRPPPTSPAGSLGVYHGQSGI